MSTSLRIRVVAFQVDIEPSPAEEDDSVEDLQSHSLEAYVQSKPVAGKFPPGSLTAYDNATLSSGLFAHYKLSEPSDVYGTQIPTNDATPPLEGTNIDTLAVMQWVIEQLRTQPGLAEADTLLVLSDTHKLEEIKHWKHTSRFILQRTMFIGPDDDRWFVLFVPSAQFDIHYTWTAVFVMQALAMFLPETDLVLWDHDAAPCCLFKNAQLETLATRCVLPYRHTLRHVGLLCCSEPHSRANAGVVWFPRLQCCEEFKHIHEAAKVRLADMRDATATEKLRLLAVKTELQRKKRVVAITLMTGCASFALHLMRLMVLGL